MLDFEFDNSWGSVLEHLPQGGTLTCHRLFAILGEVNEDTMEEAAPLLEARKIRLDVSAVPVPSEGGIAQRLQLEHQLAAEGRIPGGLEPDDSLRQFWVEAERLPRLDEAGIRALSPGQQTEGLIWLVCQEALAFAGQGLLLLDLLQEGFVGQIRYLNLPGEKNAADARYYVREAMARAVALDFAATAEGERIMTSMREYQQADRRLLQRLGRNPGIEELAMELGKTPDEVEFIAQLVQDAAAKPKQQAPAEEEEPVQEAVEDSAYFQIRTMVEELLSRLEPTDRKILVLRFGLEGHKPQTPEQVARSLGLTAADVSARELRAMSMLRS